MATQEYLWLRRLIREMVTNLNYPIQIFCNNESAIKLVGNPVFHARSKQALGRAKFEDFREALEVINNKVALKEAAKAEIRDLVLRRRRPCPSERRNLHLKEEEDLNSKREASSQRVKPRPRSTRLLLEGTTVPRKDIGPHFEQDKREDIPYKRRKSSPRSENEAETS
ncbi:hypothetical protein Salat_1448500 [Sesamum alatum]|uniref:Uncharacterized protein n=1 Tax=Sesamum alatum TaxID=300844 RepID=A0AAE2CLS9_9LAMI|nr:hypothetical protein Salat_1448500 [Sesamum alatum]